MTMYSAADEVKKLGELRDEGLLSEEEFQSQKTQALGQVPPPPMPSPILAVAATEDGPSDTSWDLSDWGDDAIQDELDVALADAGIPKHWEGMTVITDRAYESQVDLILDELSLVSGHEKSQSLSGGRSTEHSIADELTKLAALRDSGVLSDQELRREKDRVLSARSAPAHLRTSTPLGNQTSPTRDTTPSGAWLAILGGAGIAISTILPWFTVTGLIGINRNGFQLGSNNGLTFDGPICMALAVVTILIGISRLTGTSLPKYIQRSTIVTGLGVGVILVNRYSGIHDLVNQVNSHTDFSASFGYGFWLCGVGAVVALVGGFVLRSSKPTLAP
jgi:hypothetical protein